MIEFLAFLRRLGGFIEDPSPGVVITFCWVLGPMISFAGVQRLKRLAFQSARKCSPLTIEAIAATASVATSLIIMVGLYRIDWRPALSHAALIAWIYTSVVAWWMAWARKNRPDVYQALRTDRRSPEDTLEMKAEN